jgi:putative nucleotidyltransferase with HDIG domain
MPTVKEWNGAFLRFHPFADMINKQRTERVRTSRKFRADRRFVNFAPAGPGSIGLHLRPSAKSFPFFHEDGSLCFPSAENRDGAFTGRREHALCLCEHCRFAETYLGSVVGGMNLDSLATLGALVNVIDAREHEVGNHSLRVTQFTMVIGRAYGVASRDLRDLYCGALLHDIGKIDLSDDVLLKPGPLNREELEAVQRHPETGYRMISGMGELAKAAEIVMAHHEHFDGTGYPRRLRGEEIPEGARIFAVADAFDALTVQRPYRKAMSFEEARREILAESGTIFDPSVVRVFARVSAELNALVGKIVL